MSAAEALRVAQDAGVRVSLEGHELVLWASIEPAPAVLDGLSRYKSDIIDLFRLGQVRWTDQEWQSLFDERAKAAEHDGWSRLDAETNAYHDCVDQWLALHPPQAAPDGCCLRCGTSIRQDDQPTIAVACCGDIAGWLHDRCASDWKNLRRYKARTALRWLLDRTVPVL